MHVASLVFVGRGCCKNLMKSRTPGLLDLRQGAYSRETQTPDVLYNADRRPTVGQPLALTV